ncbi:MAG: HAMP domain-containing protein [Deltaproteobacteria bacterium]|jgi:two-component system phosphate regulon sensor histidine kinase PhoR|nr:HAMP domain-containing protein [Deltaproteobacteria bacterium]
MERWGLRWNLIAATMTATAAIVLTILLLEDPLTDYRLTRTQRLDLQDAVIAVETELKHQRDPDAVAEVVGARFGAWIVILERGEVIGSTRLDSQDFETSTALSVPSPPLGEDGFRRTTLGDEPQELYIYSRRLENGYVIHAMRSTRPADAMRSSVRELMLVAGALALVIGVALTWALSRTIVAPARQLTEVADALARGDLSVRTFSQRDDELGDIGRSLDRLADELNERIASLHAQENRLKTMLNAMVEAVFVTDSLGRVVLTNTALDRIAETSPFGKSPSEVLRSDALRDAVRSARHGDAVSADLILAAGGRTRTYTAVVAPLPGRGGVVGVLHDVTKQKLADRVRRDFVANASHELRTPLTAIRGFAETLKAGALSDPQSAERFVDVILRHTLRLQALVNDLVALSRAESPEQEYELASVDLAAAVRDVVQGLAAQADQRALDLQIDSLGGLPHVVANPRALDQVLINLVDNAIKYTPDGGRIAMRADVDSDSVTLEIENSGPGIPSDQLERIFERFYRVDAGRSREMGGTGLGLSIVRHLVARMGGTIEAQSAPGRWTRFRLTLGRAGVTSTRTLPPLLA